MVYKIALIGWHAEGEQTVTGEFEILNYKLTIAGKPEIYALPSRTFSVVLFENGVTKVASVGGKGFIYITRPGKDYEVTALTFIEPTSDLIFKGTVKDDAGRFVNTGNVFLAGVKHEIAYNGSYEFSTDVFGVVPLEYRGEGYESTFANVQSGHGVHEINITTTRITWPVGPVTPAKQAWINFFSHPDIVTALGTVPVATQEAFSRVFSGWSIYEDMPMAPLPGHYIAVGLMLGGIGLLTFSAILPLFPAAPFVTESATVTLSGWETASAAPAATSAISPWVKVLVAWNVATDWIWIQNMLRELGSVVSGDMDNRIRNSRLSLNEQLKEINNALSFAKTKEEFAAIKIRVDATGPVLNEYVQLLNQAGVQAKKPELYAELQSMLTNFSVFQQAIHTELGGAPLPDEITGIVTRVSDGDTVHISGFNDIRFAGIDAHEGGTPAGVAETEYLKSLILNKSVTFKIDWITQYDAYARILAVPFIDGKNVCLLMLNKFGPTILPPSKYWDRHHYIDWNENKAAAYAAAPVSIKVKLTSKPSYCNIYVDGVSINKVTPETLTFKVGEVHKIGVIKPGYIYQENTITMPAHDAEFHYVLVLGMESGAPVAPGPGMGVSVPFTLSITSVPTNAKLYIDGTYTRHYTPCNERELSDVANLLTPGDHTVKVTKAGMSAEATVAIVAGANSPVNLVLKTVGLPAP
jgi:hypothetical protein